MIKQVKRRKASKILYIVRWASDRLEFGGFEYHVCEDEMTADHLLCEQQNGRVFKVKVIDEWVNVHPRKGSILR